MATRSELSPAERTSLAASLTTRMLSANINSSYIGKSPAALKRPSETWSEYWPKNDTVGPVDKSMHLKKDGIKEYVEKALQLRDERGGMPVVASPIWAPKSSSARGSS